MLRLTCIAASASVASPLSPPLITTSSRKFAPVRLTRPVGSSTTVSTVDRALPLQWAYNMYVVNLNILHVPCAPLPSPAFPCPHRSHTDQHLQHNANKVCGDFGEPFKSYAMNIRTNHTATPKPEKSHTPVPTPTIPGRPAPTQQPTPNTPSVAAGAPPGTPGLTDESGGISDPYKHLSPEQLAALQSELREAEIAFAERFRLAGLITDDAERKTKFDGLGNSFATKQSMIRKKYGVRLRSRRSTKEIQQERMRMNYKTSAELQADMVGAGEKRRGPGLPYTAFRPENNSSGASTPVGGSSWAAVNQLKAEELSKAATGMQGSKRRFSSSNSPAPAKRVAYDDDAKKEEHTKNSSLGLRLSGAGTKEEPMALDGSSSEEESGSEGDGSDADEGIPNVLPASVLQTLQRGGSAGAAGASRPGSSSAAGNDS